MIVNVIIFLFFVCIISYVMWWMINTIYLVSLTLQGINMYGDMFMKYLCKDKKEGEE